jgi:transcriptional regulator with XRE-family HTH domain
MTELGRWLREQLKERDLTQSEAAVYAGVGQATLSDIINKGHVPKVETLFRLADYFHASREQVLRAAGHLPPPGTPGSNAEEDDVTWMQSNDLVRALLREFRRLPDEWKSIAVEQMAVFRRLAEMGPAPAAGAPSPEAKDGDGDEEHR